MSARKDLTPEEMAELRENPWIDSICGQHISYSEAFKKEAYRELMNGKSMHTIFFEHGISPGIVGDGRIYVLTYRLKKRADSEDGFKDLRANNHRKAAKPSKEQTLAARVSDLEHELAYTRQEVEFLKKYIWQIWRLGSYGNPSGTESKVCSDPGSNPPGR